MAKFIELAHYDIIKGKADGKRVINVDCIKELSGPFKIDEMYNVVRVHLNDGGNIDIIGNDINVNTIKTKIEACK